MVLLQRLSDILATQRNAGQGTKHKTTLGEIKKLVGVGPTNLSRTQKFPIRSGLQLSLNERKAVYISEKVVSWQDNTLIELRKVAMRNSLQLFNWLPFA